MRLAAAESARPHPTSALGHPRLHLKRTDSTNERARALAIAGAPHGTLVSAAEQTAGRGRQGRAWVAPAGSALLCSLVLRTPPPLLSLIAGVAMCDVVGSAARVKWPNDVVIEATVAPRPGVSPTAVSRLPIPPTTSRPPVPITVSRPPVPPITTSRPPVPSATPSGKQPQRSGTPSASSFAKLAGILVEGRPQDGWAVLGIGLNVAVRLDELPPEVRVRAASLDLPSSAIEPLLDQLMRALDRRLAEPADDVLNAWRARDALVGRHISWDRGEGVARGIDDNGRLIVALADDSTTKLDAGEVHLMPA
jgi:biotin-(acetyl-CoA carboxylase) ligase